MATPPLSSTPPAGLIAKLVYYKEKYGLPHAVGSYAGRLSPSFWMVAGPFLSRGYLHRWTSTVERRLLNLGGGSNCLSDCLTVDMDARADAYVNVTKPLPFSDASIHAIFCEEVIEHLDFPTGQRLLKECWRILVPEGVLRLTTPNLNWFANRLSMDSNAWKEMNSIFYDHRHRCIYTCDALRRCCEEAGFVNLQPSTYQEPSSRLGYLDSHADRFNHPPEMSQYLEAEKPRD